MRQGLYKQFQIAYQDTVFLISTNGLPATEEQGRDTDFQNDVWYPLCTRIDFTRMLHKYSSKEEFPYSDKQLACALGLLCRYPQQLCKDLEEVDNIKPEKVLFDESTLQQKEKNLAIEKKQEDTFAEALAKLAQ